MNGKKIKYYVLVMVFIAFIVRGMPDSILGSAWPVIRKDLNLADPKLGVISFITGGATALMSLFSSRIFGKLGAAKTALFSVIATAVAMVGFSLSHDFIIMCIWAVPIGLTAGILESELNNFVSLYYGTKYMNYLHCFYGIGVICSPYFMSLALAGGDWRKGYIYSAVLQIAVAVILAFSVPFWGKLAPLDIQSENKTETRTASFSEMLKMRPLRIMWLILIMTNVIEYTCSTWGCTYLVEAKGMSEDSAAAKITVFFLGMVLGRFISGVISEKVYTWKRIRIYLLIAAVGVALVVLPLPDFCSVIGLFVIGLGNGPVYPNLISLTPYNFGADISASVMGTQIAAAFIGVMLTPLTYGFVKKALTTSTFSVFLIISLIIMVVSIFAFIAEIKKNGHYNAQI